MSVTGRILYSDNGVISDLSKELTRYQLGSSVISSFVASQDYIYVGSLAPFNHFYLKLTSFSAVSSNVMTIQYWEGREWVNAYKTDDETVGLTQSGYVTFFPNKDKGWLPESTNDKNDIVTGLSTVSIYDMYWARIKLSQDVPLGFTMSWIGQKFSDDYDLGSEFPDIVRPAMLASFGASKTDWEEQHVKASELLVQDLIANKVIDWSGQILVREEFSLACVQKVAELVFNALGDDYLDQKDRAQAEYKRRLDKSVYRIDQNADAILSKGESTNRVGFMSR